MEKPKIIEPSKTEKDHIFQLVKLAGKKMVGAVISDVEGLHSWAGISNGFDARFLAMYYECQLQISPYTDPELVAKLEGWVTWYRKRAGKVKPVRSPSVESIQYVLKEGVQPKSKKAERDHECLACAGFGEVEQTQSVPKKCNFCSGTGWMSNAQLASFQKINVSHPGNQWQRMPHDDSWKKTRMICAVCGGDGGASGQCYKCGGTGWLYSET
jgi:hypothetical protein